MSGRYCRLEPLDPDRHGDALAKALCAPGIDRIWTYLPYGPFPSTTDYIDWPRIKEALVKWLKPDNFDPDGKQRIALSSLTQPLLHQGLAAGG